MAESETGVKKLSRLQAEAIIAGAYRIPPAGDARSAGERRDSTGDAANSSTTSSSSSATKLRSLTRLPSRGLTALATTSNEFFLQQSGVQFFVDDLVRQLQDARPEQPAPFIASYFGAVVKGTNVKGRNFEYVNGCLQNRAAFLAQLQRSYAKVDQSTVLSVGDFTELLWCQCRDLPPQLVQQASSHLDEGEDGQRRAPLRALLAAFSACFFFNEFLSKVFDIYNEMQASKDGRVCSPRSSSRSESIANAVTADRVIARLRVVAQQNTFSIPPMAAVEQIAVKSPTFKEFCEHFYESAAVASSILNLQLAFQKLASSVAACEAAATAATVAAAAPTSSTAAK